MGVICDSCPTNKFICEGDGFTAKAYSTVSVTGSDGIVKEYDEATVCVAPVAEFVTLYVPPDRLRDTVLPDRAASVAVAPDTCNVDENVPTFVTVIGYTLNVEDEPLYPYCVL